MSYRPRSQQSSTPLEAVLTERVRLIVFRHFRAIYANPSVGRRAFGANSYRPLQSQRGTHKERAAGNDLPQSWMGREARTSSAYDMVKFSGHGASFPIELGFPNPFGGLSSAAHAGERRHNIIRTCYDTPSKCNEQGKSHH